MMLSLLQCDDALAYLFISGASRQAHLPKGKHTMSEQDKVTDFSAWLVKKSPSDVELLLAYVDGDINAFDVFYDRYKRKLFNHALRICNYKTADAEDALQNVFSNFIGELLDVDGGGEAFILGKFGTKGSAQSYLHSMIHNQVMSMYRLAHRKRELPLEVSTDDQETYSVEVTDTSSIEEARSLELHHAAVKCIWLPVSRYRQLLAEAQLPIDKKRLEKDLKKAEKLAESLEQIYGLLMAGVSTEKIAESMGIDRSKTLKKRRELLADLLQPLLSDLNQ
ncbi:MAG: sigma-70 family RNA polymerase sigma factor [Thiolinea sp.]